MPLKKHYFEKRVIDGQDHLVEIREIDGLVNNANEAVEGFAVNTTVYPLASGREMIKELERQQSDHKIGVEAKERQLKEYKKKRAPVDAAFKKKFESCLSQLQGDKVEEAIKNEQQALSDLDEQLQKIKKVMPELF